MSEANWSENRAHYGMKGRCVWTGKVEEEVKEVQVIMPNGWGGNPQPVSLLVSPEHEANLRRHAARATRYYRLMIVLGSIAIAFSFIGGRGEAVGLAGVAAVLIVFPFPTPATLYIMGLRTARRVARVCGVLMLALSLVLFLFP